MFYVLGQNFKMFLKILPRFLSLVFVIVLAAFFPEFSIIVWTFKFLIVLLLMWKWIERMKKQSKLEFFKPSFLCTGLYWIIIIVFTFLKNEAGGIVLFFDGMLFIAGMILGWKALSNSWKVIQKYYPKLKMNTEVHSVDEYFEIFSRAENLEMELSKLKKEASPAVVEAIMQRKAGELIPFFHMEMVYFSVLILFGTPWLQ